MSREPRRSRRHLTATNNAVVDTLAPLADKVTCTRRAFVAGTVATPLLAVLACHDRLTAPPQYPASSGRLSVRAHGPTTTKAPGTYFETIGDDAAGFLFVPKSYRPDKASPLLVVLHGSLYDSSEWRTPELLEAYEAAGFVVVGPNARSGTWDLVESGYGADVASISLFLDHAFGWCRIDPTRVWLAGFSDGASYALSLGATNGDLFSKLIAFSPGFYSPGTERGKPRIFVSHGTSDGVLVIDQTSRVIVPILRERGYDVHYREFDGRHEVPDDVFAEAMQWLTT